MENDYDRKKIKQIMQLIVFFALIVLALLYRKELLEAAGLLISISKPFIYGGIIAFVLNIPMSFIENKLLKKYNGNLMSKLKRPVSILLSILFVVLVLTIVVSAVIPQIAKTMVELGNKIPVFVEDMVVKLEALTAGNPQLHSCIEQLEGIKIEWGKAFDYIIQFLKTGVSDMLLSTFEVAGSIIGGFMNLFIGFIFAMYILADKENLSNQGRRIISAYFNQKYEFRILKILQLLYKNFTNFVTGQCIEAVILGSMFVITMSVLQLPYAVMVGVLIAFTALIPIVGAFIGCFIGAFLILVDNPVKAVIFIVMFFVLQQIEGNLIYPKVVGNKVGLPAIWVLFAVSIGGSLFGVAGMLFFIPLTSTFYLLLRDSVNERNALKNEQQKSEENDEISENDKVQQSEDE